MCHNPPAFPHKDTGKSSTPEPIETEIPKSSKRSLKAAANQEKGYGQYRSTYRKSARLRPLDWVVSNLAPAP